MNKQYDSVALVARVLLTVMFITSGYGKIAGFDGTVGYIASQGMPLPQLMAIGAIAVELGAGILLLVGYRTRLAALAIFAFLVPATLIFHPYWAVPPEQVMGQQINFMKNVTIMGGMLMVVAFGPGRLSLDGRGS